MSKKAMLCGLLCVYSLLSEAYHIPKDFEEDKAELKALVFLSVFCPCSQSHVEHLNELEKRYRNLKIYGVITDEFSSENLPKIKDYYTEKKFKFPIIKDTKQRLVARYKALKTPHVILLKKKKEQNQYDAIYAGGVTDQRDFSRSDKKYLQENLIAYNSQKPLPYKNGRSLGCYIRRF